MTLRARVKDGAILLDQPLAFKDGTLIDVEILPVESTTADSSELAPQRNPLLDFAGVIDDPNLPTDGALNHDHYLYGAPKK